MTSFSDAVMQTGLAAFRLIAAHFGFDMSEAELERRLAVIDREPTAGELEELAEQLGFETRRMSLQPAKLVGLRSHLPALLQSSGGSYFVLDDVTETDAGLRFSIRDPLTNRAASADADQLASAWNGQALFFRPAAKQAIEEQPFGMSWLVQTVLSNRRLVAEIAVAALLGTIFAISGPFMFMIMANRVLPNNAVATLNALVVLVIVLILFEALIAHAKRKALETITVQLDASLYLYMLQRILRLPIAYFEQNPTGKITSRLGRAYVIRSFLTGQMFSALIDSVPLIGIIPALFVLDWHLASIVCVLGVILFVIVYLFIKPIALRYGRVVEAETRRSIHLLETLQGIKTVKSLSLEERRRREWDSAVAQVTRTRFDLGLIGNWPSTLSTVIERLIYPGTIIIGGYSVLTQSNPMTAGMLGAFAMLSMRLASPIVQLARLQLTAAEVGGALVELSTVMNALPEEGNDANGVRSPIDGAIEFRAVSFKYAPNLPKVLDEISFAVPAGKSIGLVGRSGSGKSTVTRLLQGLNKDFEGQIKIDGCDVRDYSLSHLRSSIGVVLQENFLFSATVRENVAIAAPRANLKDVVRACQLAGADEFIEKLPRGYDTPIAEGGANLSGGQRQRLAIARALISNPRILLMDEATSALDAESEAIINENLRSIAKGRTVVCVSHRLSMLVPFDVIVVMDKGKVYDMGSHHELLARCDIYAHLWHQQNQHVG